MKHALNRDKLGLLTPAKPIPFGNGNCFIILDAVLAPPIPHRPYTPTREVDPLASIHKHVALDLLECKPVVNLKFIVLWICAKIDGFLFVRPIPP